MSMRHSRRANAAFAASLLAGALGITGAASAAPVPFGGNSYDVVVDDQLSWTAAQSAAEAAGGHLATITSAAEQSFIESLLIDRDAPTGSYWFGLTETAVEGKFTPINGEQSSFSAFAPGEPNNGLFRDENVGAVYWTSDDDADAFTFSRRGTWNDAPQAGYPPADEGVALFPDLRRAGYLVEFLDVGSGSGDGSGTGEGGGSGTGGAGGEPTAIPIPPAILAFPGAAALAYWANRRMRRGI